MFSCLLKLNLLCVRNTRDVTSNHGLTETAIATSVLREVWAAFLPPEKKSIKGQFITECRKSGLCSSRSLCFSLLLWDKPLKISHMGAVV